MYFAAKDLVTYDSGIKIAVNDDLNDICNLLKLVVVRSNVTFPNPIYNQDILTILEKHKVKL